MFGASAFVSVLVLSSSSRQQQAGLSLAPPPRERPTARMLPCDDDGNCPDGSRCVKLFSNYGVCVLEEAVAEKTRILALER